jgi:hypothetical protein
MTNMRSQNLESALLVTSVAACTQFPAYRAQPLLSSTTMGLDPLQCGSHHSSKAALDSMVWS